MVYKKAALLLCLLRCCVCDGNVSDLADTNTLAFTNFSLPSEIEDIAKLCKLESGRGNTLAKVTVPLIAGFKFTGLLISAFTAIKIFLLQSLFISKLAFIVSFILVAKVIFDNMKKSSFKFPEVETKVIDYFPHSNSFMDYQELPAVEVDYSKYHSSGLEELQTLHNPVLNYTNIINRRTQEDLQTWMPPLTGYEYYVKRIIKEVTN